MKQTQQMALAMLALMVAGWAPTACAHDGAAERGVAAKQETTAARQETTAAVRGTAARQETTAARQKTTAARPGTAAQKETAPEEIAVTGVIEDGPDKADGTPTYRILDEATIYGHNRHDGSPLGVGYVLEGDYSAYVGQRITVYGIPRIEPGSPSIRILDVTRIRRR